MKDVLLWLAEHPAIAKGIVAVVIYAVACIFKDAILKSAAVKALIGALETPACKPARETIADTPVGALVRGIIDNRAAEADPEEDKKPESKGKRILRGLNIAAGLFGVFGKK